MNLVSNLVNDIGMRLVADGHAHDYRPRDIWRTARKRFKRRLWEQHIQNQPRFFCQNSGCCGSTYIVQLLTDNGFQRCFHERAPDFNQLGIEHYDSALNSRRLTSLLRYTRWDTFFEANNRLFSLSTELANAFPKARFIHLHRDGRAAVRSSMSKPDVLSYQQNNIRFQGTLAGKHDERPFVRCCHYWNNINRRILNDLQEIAFETGPSLSLSFDKLVAGETAALESFLGKSFSVKKRQAVNQGPVRQGGRYPDYDQWSTRDQQTFWEICGETMQRLGYSNR